MKRKKCMRIRMGENKGMSSYTTRGGFPEDDCVEKLAEAMGVSPIDFFKIVQKKEDNTGEAHFHEMSRNSRLSRLGGHDFDYFEYDCTGAKICLYDDEEKLWELTKSLFEKFHYGTFNITFEDFVESDIFKKLMYAKFCSKHILNELGKLE